jgi:hypothetical protein
MIGALLLLTLLAGPAHAQNREGELPPKILIINPLEASLQLTEQDRRLIHKAILKVCAKQTGHEIMLGELGDAQNSSFEVSHVNVSLGGTPESVTLSATLVDEKRKRLIKKIVADRIPRLQLVRKVEDAMIELFAVPQSKK